MKAAGAGKRDGAHFADLDGVAMHLAEAAPQSALGGGLVMRFEQIGSTVIGRYAGGDTVAGFLIGTLAGTALPFRYVQVDAAGQVHSGVSEGELSITPDGRRRLVEHFTWTSREGRGVNTFEEVRGAQDR